MEAKDLKSLFRPHIVKIKSYSSARSEYKGKGVFLDANENSLGSVAEILYNRYPDPYQDEIKKMLAALNGVKPENVFISNGSDEAIDYLIRITCEPFRDKILVFEPTFGMYESSATINNIDIVKIPLNSQFQINIEKAIEAITDDIKIIFICSPNNPTGNLINSEDIRILMNSFEGIVVIDEAYVDFSDANSWISQIETYPNLMVLQTFSKAWGLAALRVGVFYGHPTLIEGLTLIKQPYNVSGYSQKVIIEALKNIEVKNRLVKEIKLRKAELEEELKLHKVVKKVYPSDANFFLVKVENANDLYKFLVSKQIIVRNRHTAPGCENCLRITVGSKEDNQLLIKALDEYTLVEKAIIKADNEESTLSR